MKLGPIEFGRARAAQDPGPEPPPPPRRKNEIGASGTVNLSGYLQQLEYDHELRAPGDMTTWLRMTSSDGSVREAVDHIIAPLKNADCGVDPASDDPLDLEVAEFARNALFEWTVSPWVEFVEQAMEYLWAGRAIFELGLQVVEKELTYLDPTTRESVTIPARQFVTLARMAQRLPETIVKWNTSGGILDSVEQWAFKDDGFGTFTIPAERLLVLTNRRRGDEFTGQSILRPARKPWIYKDLIEKIQAISLERWGVGIPVAYPPESAGDDQQVQDALEDILVNLRGGEFSYIVAPGPRATAAVAGYLFEILSPSGAPPDFESALNYHRAEIKAAVLARFAELGHQTTGARATGDIQSVVWFAALHAVAHYFAQSMQSVIVRLVDMNYQVTQYPTLAISGIEVRNLAEFAEAVAKAVASGAMRPDTSLRGWVREAFNAPDEDEPGEADEDTDPSLDPAAPDPGDDPVKDEPAADPTKVEEE